jgi:hypothetical protein
MWVIPSQEQTRGKAGGQSNFGGGGAFYMPVRCSTTEFGVKFARNCRVLTTAWFTCF